jgi:hypothetical protein
MIGSFSRSELIAENTVNVFFIWRQDFDSLRTLLGPGSILSGKNRVPVSSMLKTAHCSNLYVKIIQTNRKVARIDKSLQPAAVIYHQHLQTPRTHSRGVLIMPSDNSASFSSRIFGPFFPPTRAPPIYWRIQDWWRTSSFFSHFLAMLMVRPPSTVNLQCFRGRTPEASAR